MMIQFADAEPRPNAGHNAIAALARTSRLELVVTQNIDGLHQASGVPAHKVVEVHGGTSQTCCLSCGDKCSMEEVLRRVRAGERDPRCEASGMAGRECHGFTQSPSQPASRECTEWH
jgi:NAD-dependent deacetylase